MRRLGLVGLVVCALALVGGMPAQAVRTTGWADWTPLTGTANDYTATMSLTAGGFPSASVTSDSRAGQVGVQSGASVWFGAGTAIGAKYGSSQNRPYLNLRPRADTPTTPSTTTYVFETPTPPLGWAFALGDIDADQATVTATDAGGAPVSAVELGFVESFNLCDTTPRPAGCSAATGDAPTWNPATRTLTGNPAAADSFGASAWFEPSVPLSTLTVVFTRRSGFPVYQTWFASVARTISGTVADVSTEPAACPVTGVTVRLVGPYGDQLATTTPDATGAYSFGQYATQPGYVVSVEPPAACAVVGPQTRVVSTAADDAAASFEVREIVPQPVSGTVTADGAPLSGVPVTLTLPGGATKTTTTDAAGAYLFDENPVGDDYVVSIDVPDGYSGPATRPPFDITTTPVTGQDFALTADPDVSGSVTGGGDGLGGVTVTLTPAQGDPVNVVTAADGSYTFERVPPGTYTISVVPPPGFDPVAPRTGVVVSGDDVVDQDFALTRPGALGGTVHLDTADGPGFGGATVEITGPGGPRTVIADADGGYFVDALAPGTYEIRLAPPPGYVGVGSLVRTVTITDAGEIRGGQDFVVTAAPSPTASPTSPTASPTPSQSPTPTPSSSPSPTGSPSNDPSSNPSASPTDPEPTAAPTGGGGDLPPTGNAVGLPLVLLGLALLVGGTAALGAGLRLRRGEH